MISYSKQSISEKDIGEVKKVLKSDYLTQGPKVPIFEEKIRKYVMAHQAGAWQKELSIHQHAFRVQ